MRKSTFLLILGIVSNSLGIGGFTYYWTPSPGDTVTRNRLKYNYDSIRVWAGRASDTINSKVNPVYYKRGDILIDTLNATKAIIDTSKTRSARSTRLQADSAFITSNMNIGSATRDSMLTISGGLHVKGGVKVDLLSGTIDSARAAGTATKLTTARTIGLQSFDGTANIIPDTAKSSKFTTQLQTARTIGGTSFDGTANIVPDSSRCSRNVTGGNALADSLNIHGMVINKLGNVGIGTTSPGANLELYHSGAGNTVKATINSSGSGSAFFIYDTGTSTGPALYIDGTRTGTQKYLQIGNVKFAVLANGNVGVGTGSPDSLLTVSGGIRTTGGVDVGGQLKINTNLLSRTGSTSKGTSFDPSDRLKVTNTAGLVTDARYSIECQDDASMAAGVGAGILFEGKYKGDGTYNVFGGIKGIKTNATEADYKGQLHFQTSTGASVTTKMVIDENGNVGIGTTSPSYRLHAYQTGGDCVGLIECGYAYGSTELQLKAVNTRDAQLSFADGDDHQPGAINYSHLSNQMAFRTNGAWRMYIDSVGKIGIGTASPTRKLDVNGTVKANYFTTASGDSFIYNDTTFLCTLKTTTGDTMKDFGGVRAIVSGDKITLAFPDSSLSSSTPLGGAYLYVKINPSILWPTSIRIVPVVANSGELGYVKMNTNGKLEVFSTAGTAMGGLYLGNVISYVK